MRIVVLLGLLILVRTATARPLTEMLSPTYHAHGSHDQILERGAQCLQKLAKFESVRRRPHASGGVGASQYAPGVSYSGGPVIIERQPGAVLARHRASWSLYLDKRSIQTRIAFEAREDRFRIRFYEIGHLNLESGTKTEYEAPEDDGRAGKETHLRLTKLMEDLKECVEANAQEVW